MAPQKAAITTHVLDQATGSPAPNIEVRLQHSTAERDCFFGTTDQDGRISNWRMLRKDHQGIVINNPSVDYPEQANDRINNMIDEEGGWNLTFDTNLYFEAQGKKSVWSNISLNFETVRGDRGHWHMPVLLGQFGYTAYRGS